MCDVKVCWGVEFETGDPSADKMTWTDGEDEMEYRRRDEFGEFVDETGDWIGDAAMDGFEVSVVDVDVGELCTVGQNCWSLFSGLGFMITKWLGVQVPFVCILVFVHMTCDDPVGQVFDG